MKRFMIFALFAIILMLTACNRGRVEGVERNPNGGVDVTVSITEAEVTGWIADVLTVSGNPLLRDPQVDLQNGQIVVTGEHERRDGSGQRVGGSLIFTLSVVDGALLAQVVDVQIEGITLDDPAISTINQQLVNRLQRRADPDNRAINFVSITITNDEIRTVINARRVNQ
ncbi:MAG: hypothetical protein Kow00117_11840 [Phototrophicales bacterium]|nr:MAG: hypothetical protein CUN56_09265 [Phototrophicales bacterium]RMG74752.1 MAG: hypothetical protein D6711_08120 [Chloroflexota bacterium]